MKFNRHYKFSKENYIYTFTTLSLALLVFFYLRFFYGIINPVSKILPPIPIMRASIEERLLTLPKVLSYYLKTFVFPKVLAISQHWLVETINTHDFYIPFLISVSFFALCIAVAIYFIRKRGIFNSYLLFSIWFLLTWVMVWQVYPLDMTVADRWFYLPMVGLLGMIGVLLNTVNIKNIKVNYLFLCLGILFILVFSLRTIVRNTNWKDGITLFAHDAKINTDSFSLEGDLGYLYLISSQPDKAKPHIDRSIELAPYWWENWNNLGAYFEMKGEIDESINAFRKALENNNNYYHGTVSLAHVYFVHKSPQEAKEEILTAIDKFPQVPYLWYILGMTEYKLGNKNDALAAMFSAYSLSKDNEYMKTYYLMEKDEKID